MKFHSIRLIALTLSIVTITIGLYTTTSYLFPPVDDTPNALTYSNSTNVSFTFDPKLSIALSANDLTIENIVPSTAKDSNSITVAVSSNTPYGYTLSASVGSNDSESTYYNTSNLIHKDSTLDNIFTSIATNASEETLTTDNTWGYSTSIDNGTTWSAYSGLSSNTNKTLLGTNAPAASSTIDFKIAAKSSITQASGTYNNIITFYAVGKPAPLVIDDLVYMQDFKNLTDTDKESVFQSMPIGQQYRLTDNRDGIQYWLAKQADGNIWMTQNLDLCIGCAGTSPLTSQNTDINTSSYPYNSDAGYTEADGTITWTPNSTAITSNYTITDTTVSPAFPRGSSQDYRPHSAEGNDIYIYTSSSADKDIVYNSIDQCTNANHSTNECSHYHIGNYYDWSAAIATNTSSAAHINSPSSNSICPSGWRLPIIKDTSSPTPKTTEFGYYFFTSKVIGYIFSEYYLDNGFNIVRTSPLYFTRGGYIESNSLKDRASSGQYWSSVGGPTTAHAKRAGFDSQIPYPNTSQYRTAGYSIRCLVR